MRESIKEKHASHGSGGWIKASCCKSLPFCKKNIHIWNVINTSLSLPLTFISGSPSGGWRRTSALRDKWERRERTKRRSRIRSKKRGFVKKNIGGLNFHCWILSPTHAIIFGWTNPLKTFSAFSLLKMHRKKSAWTVYKISSFTKAVISCHNLKCNRVSNNVLFQFKVIMLDLKL